MNTINWDNLGGMPFSQTRMKFLQATFSSAFMAVAKLCGDRAILFGVELMGGNITDGWISVDGELLPFVGGSPADQVVIVETLGPFTYANNTINDVTVTRYATCGNVGAFPFSELERITTLQNTWRPGNIKEHYCDMDYIAANFDPVTGVGINKEKGWRILSKAIPSTAGKTFVNIDFVDPDFNTIGAVGGEKQHILTSAEHGKLKFRGRSDDGDTDTGNNRSMQRLELGGVEIDVSGLGSGQYTVEKLAPLEDATTGHNNMQPYFVILKLLKL